MKGEEMWGRDGIRFDADDGIQQLRYLEKGMSSAIEKIEEEARGRSVIEEIATESYCDEQEKAEFISEILASNQSAADQTVDIVARAFFLSGYAVFETSCVEIARNFEVLTCKKAISKKLKNMAYVEGVGKQTTEAASLFESNNWTDLQHFQSLRNQIAHEGGLFGDSDEDQKLIEEVSKFHGISFVPHGHGGDKIVKLYDLFVRHAFSQFQVFIENLQTCLGKAVKC